MIWVLFFPESIDKADFIPQLCCPNSWQIDAVTDYSWPQYLRTSLLSLLCVNHAQLNTYCQIMSTPHCGPGSVDCVNASVIYGITINHERLHSIRRVIHNLPKSPLISPSPPHYITRHYSPFNFIPISANQHLFQTNFFPLPSTFGIRYQPIFLIILYQI